MDVAGGSKIELRWFAIFAQFIGSAGYLRVLEFIDLLDLPYRTLSLQQCLTHIRKNRNQFQGQNTLNALYYLSFSSTMLYDLRYLANSLLNCSGQRSVKMSHVTWLLAEKCELACSQFL